MNASKIGPSRTPTSGARRATTRRPRHALALAAAAGLLAPAMRPAAADDGTGLSFNGTSLFTGTGAPVPAVQDFSSLPTTSFNSQATDPALTGPNPGFVDNSTVPGWYAYETVLGAPSTYNGNTSGFKEFVGDGTPKPGTAGAQTLTGGLFTLLNGTTGTQGQNNGVATQTSHLALGAAGTSSSGDVSFGVKIFNDTNTTYKTFSFSYKGEEWFNGSQNSTPLQFQYAINPGGGAPIAPTFKGNANTTATTGYVVPTGNAGTFSPPNNLDDNHVDGTLPANSQVINPTITLNTPWAPGQALYLTWTIAGAGKGPALGITDFTGFSAGTNTAPAGHTLNWNPGSTTWNAANTANTNWKDTTSGASTFYTEGDTVNFTDTGVGTVTVDASGVNPAALNVSNTTGTYTFTGGPIAGGGALTKTGAGTLVLASPNSFSGGLAVNGGTVRFSNDNQLGATTAAVSLDSGGTLQPAAAFASARPITIGTGGGTLDTQSFNASTSGKFTANGPFVKTGSGTLTFTGGVASVSTSSFTVAAGSGNVIFQGISGSAQTIVAPSTAGGINGNLVVNAPVKFTIAGGFVDGTGQIQVPVSGAAVIGATPSDLPKGGTTLMVNVPIVLNTAGLPNTTASPFVTTIGMSSAGNTLQLMPKAVISGNANVVLSNDPAAGGGAGTVVLGAVNTYTGTTTLNMSGIAQLGVDNALPAGGGLTFGDGVHTANIGTLDLAGHNLTLASLATNLPNGSASTQQLANGITNTGSALSTLSVSGSATTTFSGIIGTPNAIIVGGATDNIALHLLAANTGSLTLTGANTFNGGITIDGGTLVIGTPNVFGSGPSLPAGSNVANNAAFVVNSDSTAGSVSGTGTTTVGTGVNFQAAGFTQGALVNNGSTDLTGTGNAGAVTGAGNLTADTSAAVSVKYVRQQGAFTVNGAVTVVPKASGGDTSVVGSLTFGSAGTLDLNNNGIAATASLNGAAATTTDTNALAQAAALVKSGYAGGANNGPGVFSSSARTNATVLVGFARAADVLTSTDGGTTYTFMGQSVPAAAVVVRPTWAGDTNLDGQVTSADVRRIITAGHYNDGTGGHFWSDGDLNHDGFVNNTDVRMIITGGHYNDGTTYSLQGNAVRAGAIGSSPAAAGLAGPAGSGAATPAPAAPAPTLTVTSNATTAGKHGDGKLSYVYTPATGDVTLDADGVGQSAQTLQELDLVSAGNKFIAAGAKFPAGNFNSTSSNELDSLTVSGFFADGFDIGNVLPTNLTLAQLTGDLSLYYSLKGQSGPVTDAGHQTQFYGDTYVAGTPEPASLGLLAAGALGLLARRRRRPA